MHVGTSDKLEATENIVLYPNPTSGALHLRYSILETRDLKLELYNITGIRMKTLLDTQEPAGEYELEFDISELPDGMYYIRMQLGKQVQTRKIVKVDSNR
jgi:hypothetical protein